MSRVEPHKSKNGEKGYDTDKSEMVIVRDVYISKYTFSLINEDL